MNRINFFYNLLTKSSGKGALDTLSRKLRFIIRTLFTIPYSILMLNFIYKHQYLSTGIFTYMTLLSKIYRPYLSSIFGLKSKYQLLIENYKFIDKYFPNEFKKKLYNREKVTLAKFKGNKEEFEIFLSFYPNFDKEGDIEIKLKDSNNIYLSTITFSITKYNGKYTLFIGGIQGPKKGTDKEYIKKITKNLYGIFPKKLLLEALYSLVRYIYIDLEKICVGDKVHIYTDKRYIHKKKIRASYDEFIKSLNGIQQKNGLWKLPNELTKKPIDSISSNKRSEYKKRYQILEEIDNSIKKVITNF